jgi:hypothetical protein
MNQSEKWSGRTIEMPAMRAVGQPTCCMTSAIWEV